MGVNTVYKCNCTGIVINNVVFIDNKLFYYFVIILIA